MENKTPTTARLSDGLLTNTRDYYITRPYNIIIYYIIIMCTYSEYNTHPEHVIIIVIIIIILTRARRVIDELTCPAMCVPRICRYGNSCYEMPMVGGGARRLGAYG